MTVPPTSALLDQIAHHRTRPRGKPDAVEPIEEGEESVWGFPRPPRVETVAAPLRVKVADVTIARTDRALRVVETSGAPVYYIPEGDVDVGHLRLVPEKWSLCEWKGISRYFDVVVGTERREEAAFAYTDVLTDLGQGFERLLGHIAFDASRVDEAWIGDVRAAGQPGGYYAGWVTPALKGPIKGGPGSEGW